MKEMVNQNEDIHFRKVMQKKKTKQKKNKKKQSKKNLNWKLIWDYNVNYFHLSTITHSLPSYDENFITQVTKVNS